KREAACGWFLKWLKGEGDGRPIAEPAQEIAAWDAAELRCFPPGENRPAGPGLIALAKSIAEKKSKPQVGSASPGRSLYEVLGIPNPLPLPAAPDLLGLEGRLSLGAMPEGTRRGWRMPDGVFVPAILLRPPGEIRGAV